MERAQQRAEARDDISGSGTNRVPLSSIASIPNEVVIVRASRLGVSLGVSPTEINSSVNLIKNIDLNRTITFLKKNEDELRRGRMILVVGYWI